MGILIDQLDRLSVEACSPDGCIRAEARGRYRISIQFRRNAYPFYAESVLGQQIAHLATLTWSRYRREYVELVNAFVDDSTGEDSECDRWFSDGLKQMIVTGSSASGRIRLRSRALVRWECVIAPGTVRALTERDFLAELDQAVAEVTSDYRARVIMLTDEVYGLALPQSYRSPTSVGSRNR